ncbi:MAG: class I SAM-dependent methyltransferase [Anaerolineales bacterium]
MPDNSWRLGSGPGHPLYELYDALRRRLNGRITGWMAARALQGGGIAIEAGSGTGYASSLLAAHARLSIAVDNDPAALAAGRAERPGLVGVVADIRQLPFRADAAQLVWNSSTVEHLPDPAQVVAEMARVAAPAGTVYVGVPWRRGPLFFQRWIANTALGVWLGTVYGRADVENWLRAAGCAPYDAWQYFVGFFVGVAGRKTG